MFVLNCIALVSGLFHTALAQTSTYDNPGVPTNEPLPGNYTGAYRPRVHFSPPINFMNDPNGLHLDANGTWHLYYQYNPVEPVAGEQHWGHATSSDLYHWENQKIAIWPTNSTDYVYSGSAVVDMNNTSGFFPNQTMGLLLCIRWLWQTGSKFKILPIRLTMAIRSRITKTIRLSIYLVPSFEIRK